MTLPQIGGGERLDGQLAAMLGQMPDPSGGPAAGQLERELAEAFGVPHAVALSSGTAALHAALSACGISPRRRGSCAGVVDGRLCAHPAM
ncbi:hypothetical protein GCM10009733_006310 [Nonomuraea maheshkhaliensis]|uniref:DegT/DnrJ/EryC1/StrS aminotransferase family protein n=1 Tax=Nonomuraea maheshkhaliensis TaxID=419590 RepID=A0ABP4QIT5_9ACTN